MKLSLTEKDVEKIVIEALVKKGILSGGDTNEAKFSTYDRDFMTIEVTEPKNVQPKEPAKTESTDDDEPISLDNINI